MRRAEKAKKKVEREEQHQISKGISFAEKICCLCIALKHCFRKSNRNQVAPIPIDSEKKEKSDAQKID